MSARGIPGSSVSRTQAKILRGLRLWSDRLLQQSGVLQWRGGKSQWSRVGCLWFSAIRMSPKMLRRGEEFWKGIKEAI